MRCGYVNYPMMSMKKKYTLLTRVLLSLSQVGQYPRQIQSLFAIDIRYIKNYSGALRSVYCLCVLHVFSLAK